MNKDNLGKAKKKISIIAAYKEVFSSHLGKIVLLDLMKSHYVNGTTFDPDNTNLTILREGERNVVLRILNRMKVDVKELYKNLDELEKQEQDQN